MQETMKAVVLTGHGGLEKLDIRDVPIPRPGPHDALIKVGACGLNNTDVNTRLGWYAKSVTSATDGPFEVEDGGDWGGAGLRFPRIQGADAVGKVVALGSEANLALEGKRVMVDVWLRDWNDPLNRDKMGYFGSECDGGFAEYAVVDHRNLGVIDSDLTDAELATFCCSYTTAEGMLTRAEVGPEDRVLVTGASGGVGSALLQLARRRGAEVIGLASENKHAALTGLGAHLLPRAPEDLPAALEAISGHRTVTVVADVVGGTTFSKLIEVLARGGRYTCSGAIAGPIVSFDLRTLYLNDLTFTGSTCVPPEIFRTLLNYISKDELKPMLAATYPLEKFHAAQQAFIDKRHIGNIVVTP